MLKKHNFRHKEIAEMLGLTIHAVNKMAYRTKKRIDKYPDCINYKELDEIFASMKKQIDDYFR